jgi:hypothetical protein
MMRAALSEIEITPREFGRLGRLIAPPTQVTGVRWPLYARIFLLENGATRLAVISVDMNFIFAQNIPELRVAVAAAAGLDPAHIMIACTHTHNSFNTIPWVPEDTADYAPLDFLKDRFVALAADAAGRLEPCRLKAGSGRADGLTQNRRPLYRDAAGALHVGTHGPENVENFVRTEGPTDDEVKVLLVESESGRCLGGLVNVAVHPTTMFNEPVYSSSYIGPLTEALKAEHGGVFGFLYGLSGNLCARDRGPGETLTQKVGDLLAAAADHAIASAVPLGDERLAVSREVLAGAGSGGQTVSTYGPREGGPEGTLPGALRSRLHLLPRLTPAHGDFHQRNPRHLGISAAPGAPPAHRRH